MIRNLFLELFRPEGISIRAAASGQEAISLLKQSAPSLLIVDVSLPDSDGITVLEEAQKIDNRIIGVVMTGSPTIELAVRAMKAGATDFLMKPIQNDVLLMVARRLLELHRLRGENTVLKHAAVRAGAVRLHSLPLQTFGEDGSLRGEDGLTEFERGLAEGERRAEEQRRYERTLFATAVRKLGEARMSLQHTIEDDVVTLAIQIVSKVLRKSANECADQIITQAKSALATIRESGVVVLRVHPADAAALESARAELSAQRDITLAMQIEPDPALSRGACLVHTENRLIDASLETQLLRVGDALKNRANHEF
jgi:CheY-like chemotaxis protein